MTNTRGWLFFAVVAINLAAVLLIVSTPTRYKVDFSSILEIWGDVFRDVDKVGLTVTSIPVEREIEIGNSVVAEHFHSQPDPVQLAYVNHVGGLLAANARRRRIEYQFHIVEAPFPNAFALPGGHVVVTTTMLALIESEAELASILGHEIAHVDLKHCVENLQYELAAKRIVGDQLSRIVGTAYQLAAFGFSEIQEREADRTGVLLMAEADYYPLEALTIASRVERRFAKQQQPRRRPRGPEGELLQSLGDALGDYFETHPRFATRKSDMKSLIERNRPSWEGKTFYIGRTNYSDLVSRDQDDRSDERIVFGGADGQAH